MNSPPASPTPVEFFSVIFLGCQTLATIMAAIFAYLAFDQVNKISKSQSSQTDRIHRDQIRLTKQQAFIPLSQQLSEIRYINPDDPQWLDVSQSSNSLELIAVAWEDRLISRKLLLTVYGRLFMSVFEQIYLAKDQETGEERGKIILTTYCPKSVKFYGYLCKRYKLKDIRLASQHQ